MRNLIRTNVYSINMSENPTHIMDRYHAIVYARPASRECRTLGQCWAFIFADYSRSEIEMELDRLIELGSVDDEIISSLESFSFEQY
jgi:hypothetical protein